MTATAASLEALAAARQERPATLGEAAEALRRADQDRERVLFLGGGTELSLGAPPAGVDLVLGTERLERIVEHAPLDQIVIVEAGVRLSSLQDSLAASGQMLGLDAPWAARATLGGLVATNAFGPLRTRYGSVRDLIIGISIIRADGTEAHGGGKVVKNVAGFDLPKLMVGSLGTLGFISTVTFRLHPRPEASRTVLFPDLDADAVRRVVLVMRQAQLEPGAAAALVHEGGDDLGVRFDGRFELGVRFDGFEAGVRQQSMKLLDLATRQGWGAESLGAEVARAFWARHDDARESPAGFRAKLAAQPMDLERVANGAIGSLFAALEVPRCVCYPTLGLAFVAGEIRVPGQVAAAVNAAREAVPDGSVVVHAAPPEVRGAVDVWGPPPAALPLMRAVKDRLDPGRRLAPGRFVGGL
ncbi:MAG TPA: FAD-binding oxidoreductase [Myxococcaceae bacterium]|nr:FAD-binding oxidoreductase [Myxococcaceae bacterium]